MAYGERREILQEAAKEKALAKAGKIQDTGTQLSWDEEEVYEKVGNLLTLGVAGEHSGIEALMLVVLVDRFSKTKEGVLALQTIISKYLDNMGRIISSMQNASASNWLTAAINQCACSNIYVRMGLISPRDHYRTLLWTDHVFGEMLKKDYIRDTVSALTTLVNSSQTTAGGGTAGIANLMNLAKLYGGGK
jgi:hypothetical protein